MQLQLLSIGSKNPEWLDVVLQGYDEKISFHSSFKRKLLKSKSSPRNEAQVKKESEGKEILKNIGPKDFLILLDENGKSFKSSTVFSIEVEKVLSSTANNIIFLIGGAYGVTDDVKKRANLTWSLSGLTMNHHIIQLVLCEQLYRALTIWKGIPYHND